MAIIEQIIHSKLKREHINILNPKTIQEKLNWLKFHGSTPLKGKCSDKIALHDYCKEVLGSDICVPIRKTYDKVSDMKMSDLPDKFVLKTNHGNKMSIVCRDKSTFDFEEAKTRLNCWLKYDFGHDSGQPQFQYIHPRIMAEDYLEDEFQKSYLFKYRFWCFGGKVKMWSLNYGILRRGTTMYFDADDQELDLYEIGKYETYRKPDGLSLMKEYAEKLSSKFIFAVVEFHEIGGRVYLNKMDFTPENGYFNFKKSGANEMVGSWLKLPTRSYPEGVSVCLTGFKVQDYVEETLDSVAAQTWFKTHDNWEMIVGIDGCQASLDKVKSIMGKYKNLRVLMMEANCGTYVTTNTVMSEAKYDHLIRFDCDDVMLPGMVETIMKEKGDADFINFQLTNFGKRSGTNKACGQVCFKHSLFDRLGGYLPWTCSADSEFEFRVKGIAKVKYIKKSLLRRRVHGGNLTSRKETGYRSALRTANMRYALAHRSGFKNKQEAVAVRITNSFTEIKNPSTVPSKAKYPFPKLDVVFQEHMEWKLEREQKELANSVVSAVVDNYVYTEEHGLKRKTYATKSNPLVRKKKASDFLREYLAK